MKNKIRFETINSRFTCAQCTKSNEPGSAGRRYPSGDVYGRDCHVQREPVKAYFVVNHEFICRTCHTLNAVGSTGAEWFPGVFYGKDCHSRPTLNRRYINHKVGRVNLHG